MAKSLQFSKATTKQIENPDIDILLKPDHISSAKLDRLEKKKVPDKLKALAQRLGGRIPDSKKLPEELEKVGITLGRGGTKEHFLNILSRRLKIAAGVPASGTGQSVPALEGLPPEAQIVEAAPEISKEEKRVHTILFNHAEGGEAKQEESAKAVLKAVKTYGDGSFAQRPDLIKKLARECQEVGGVDAIRLFFNRAGNKAIILTPGNLEEEWRKYKAYKQGQK